MTLRLLLAAFTLAGIAHAADFDRTLNVSSTPDLYVSTGSGNVRIHSGSDSQIHIHAHIHSRWNAGKDLNDRMARISDDPPIQQSGDSVHVGEARAQDRYLYNNIAIDYEITAPKAVALNLRSGSGDVEVDHLGRFLKAETGSGSIRAYDIAGPSDVHTGSGDIELEQAAVAEVRVSTGSGSIRVHRLNGAFTAKSGSGDIEADGSITGSSRLTTGSGSIRLHIGRDAHYNVEASTGSGSISLAGVHQPEHHHVSEPVNGGGPTVEAHTGSGDIGID